MRLSHRHRHRRLLGARWRKALPWLGFQYDYQRSTYWYDAYILRRVGRFLGPVFVVERQPLPGREVIAVKRLDSAPRSGDAWLAR